MKKILFMMLGVLIALPAFARDFTYEYGGQTLTYTVLDENAKTCKTKNGSYQSSSYQPGNEVSGNLVLPANPKDGEVEYTLTTIGTYAFSLCSGLTSVSIPNTVTSIGYAAFYKCSGLTSFNIPNSVTSIGEYAFASCSGLTSVNIPNSVTSIGKLALSYCSGLKTLIIEDGDTELNVGDRAFKSSPLENLTIGRNWTYGGRIGMSTGIKNLTLTNGVTVIPDYAFHKCSGLTSVNIPESVTSIGESAFSDCSGLKTLIIEDGDTELNVGSFAFASAPLENLTIGRNWTYGGIRAMSTDIKNLTLTNGVTVIPDYAFYNCSGLTSVNIPESVTSIGSEAFYNCSGLKTLIIEDGDTELNVGDSAFQYSPIENLSIGRNWTYGGSGAMTTSIKNLTLTNGVTVIPKYAFHKCSGLTSVSIPNTVTSIGYAAFYKCSGLTSFNIPNSVTSIGESAFSDCSGLKTLIIEDGDTELNVGNGAFNYSPIENLSIGRNWTYGGRGAMTTSIKNLTLTNGVTVIPDYAFHNCSNLLMLSIGNNITSVDASYFEGCNNLSSLTIADGPNPIELSGDWKNFTNLENLTINRNFTITK